MPGDFLKRHTVGLPPWPAPGRPDHPRNRTPKERAGPFGPSWGRHKTKDHLPKNLKTCVAPILAVAALALAFLGSMSPDPALADLFPTQKQLDLGLNPMDAQSAMDKAKAEGKIVLLYFWAVWCGNCQIFSDEVLSDPAIIEALNKDFTFVSVDVDQDKPAAESFRVRAVPTIIFLESDGKPVSVLPGAIPGQIFTMVLDYMSGGAYKTMEFAEYYKANAQGQSEQAGSDDPSQGQTTSVAGAKTPSGPGLKPLAQAFRQAVEAAMTPANQSFAITCLHVSLRSLTTQSYWAGLSLLGGRLKGWMVNELPTVTESNPFHNQELLDSKPN